MNKPELLEQKGRNDAYLGKGGVTYYHRPEPFGTSVWHYLKDVVELELRPPESKVNGELTGSSDAAALKARVVELDEAEAYEKRMTKLKESWATSPDGLLTKLLSKAASLKPLPKNAKIFTLRAEEDNGDISWGSGGWSIGMVGTQKAEGSLIVDIKLADGLVEDEDIRRQVYGFAAGAVAMKCIPYDRGKDHPLSSVWVRAAPNADHALETFDYVLERLQRDQQAELAMLGKHSSVAMQAGLAAIEAAHRAELAELGVC